MEIASLKPAESGHPVSGAAEAYATKGRQVDQSKAESGELRKQFDTFVGEAFYGQMLASMRKTQGKTAYFNGGKAEEVFRGQLDQVLATKMTEASAREFTGPMFELFQLNRA